MRQAGTEPRFLIEQLTCHRVQIAAGPPTSSKNNRIAPLPPSCRVVSEPINQALTRLMCIMEIQYADMKWSKLPHGEHVMQFHLFVEEGSQGLAECDRAAEGEGGLCGVSERVCASC